VSVNGNEEPRWRDLSPIQFSCNYNYSLITHNKTPVHSTWGLLRVCGACPTPRLNLSSELRPSGNNIQYTFLTGSATDTTQEYSVEVPQINRENCLLFLSNLVPIFINMLFIPETVLIYSTNKCCK